MRLSPGTKLAVGLLLTFLALAARAQVRLEVRGVEGELERNIRAYAPELPDSPAEVGTSYQRRLQEAAVQALEALGYYNPTIELLRRPRGEELVLELSVQSGPRVEIAQADIQLQGGAADDEAFAELIRQLPLRAGAPLHHGEYEAAKRALQNLALRRGYFEASFTRSRVLVDAVANTALIQLTFASGERYALGQVRFGDTPFRDELLRRLVPFEPGEPYEADKVVELNRALLDSGYFQDVRVRPQPEAGPPKVVPVAVELEAAERNRVAAGVGYSTDVGPRLSLTWNKPWVNSRGHSLESTLELSEVRQSLTVSYKLPLESLLTDFVEIQGGVRREDFEDTENEETTLGVQRQVLLDNGWRRSVYLRWDHSSFRQGVQRGSTDLIVPGVSFTRTRVRGSAVDPAGGDRILALVEATDPALGSDIGFVRTRLGARWLYSLADDHRIFARVDAGGLLTDRFAELPPSLRFFAGGAQSIRGYDYNSISPSRGGELVGGKYLLVGGLEYDWRFHERWALALFADAGNAMNVWSEDYKVGAGFGVHWISPVGPIRLEFAWPVSEEDGSLKIHFSMGSRL